MTRDQTRTSILVIPTYNESENIERFLRDVRSHNPGLAIVVVDDLSPDGTGEILDLLATEDKQLSVIHRSGNRGLGAAYLAGFDYALKNGFSEVVTMDADSSHDPNAVSDLLRAIHDGADVSIGSRFVPGGSIIGWPFHRMFLSRYGNYYTRFVVGLVPRDCTSGFRAYRASALSMIDLPSIKGNGYVIQISILRRIQLRRLKVAEVPITFVDRVEGRSKMSTRIVVESLVLVTLFGLKDLLRGRR